MKKNKDKLKQCVQDLKQYLVTVQNGQALLSAVQQQGSEKHAFLAALKTITDVEEKFNYFQQNYLKDEQIQYEHDHTTINARNVYTCTKHVNISKHSQFIMCII